MRTAGRVLRQSLGRSYSECILRLRGIARILVGGALLVAMALFVPSAALAACVPPRGPHSYSEAADLVVDAVALDGPQSPARFEVRRYEKGVGPTVVLVQTGVQGVLSVGEGIAPHAGERYRIFGTRTSAGVIETGVCAGTRRIEHEAGALVLRAGARRAPAVRSTYLGHGFEHSPNTLRVNRGGLITVTLERPSSAGFISVINRSGRLVATAKPDRSARRFTFRLPTRINRPQTMILDTGEGFYAVGVAPTQRRH